MGILLLMTFLFNHSFSAFIWGYAILLTIDGITEIFYTGKGKGVMTTIMGVRRIIEGDAFSIFMIFGSVLVKVGNDILVFPPALKVFLVIYLSTLIVIGMANITFTLLSKYAKGSFPVHGASLYAHKNSNKYEE